MAKEKKRSKKEAEKSFSIATWEPHLVETAGFFIIALSLLLELAFASTALHGPYDNYLGMVGSFLGAVFHAGFGLSAYLIPLCGVMIGWGLLMRKPLHDLSVKIAFCFVAIIAVSLLLTVFEDYYPFFAEMVTKNVYPYWYKKGMGYPLGGIPFLYFFKQMPLFNLRGLFNTTGVVSAALALLIGSFCYLFKVPLSVMIHGIKNLVKLLFSKTMKSEVKEEKPLALVESEPDFMRYVELRMPEEAKKNSQMLAIQPELKPQTRPSMSKKTSETKQPEPIEKKSKQESSPIAQAQEELKTRFLSKPTQAPASNDRFQLPSLNLITPPKKVDTGLVKKDLKKQAEVLEETLLSFGIEAKVGQINCGPTITSFEVHPSIGVKVQKIKTLENDIALNMEAKSIRIIAPIPGKAAVGIEVPNLYPQEVGFKDMLAAYQAGSQKFKVPVLLGKAVNGDFVMNDLAKMPHCIIAGATGSGKSVCINTIVMSIVMSARPDEIRLLMVDPKKVELTPYSQLPHMIAPVITEPHGAANALKWLVHEMELRYEILKQVGVRNIEGFNTRKKDPEQEASCTVTIPEKLFYIVLIVDELADLMMVAAAHDIETPIARIAQMARAVGIHMILATQRPSREVITGLIKANFPTRICFKVASRINSQIVLDEVGAESLLGNGDMLFLPPGTSQLIRAQGAYIRDDDILSVIQHIRGQGVPQYLIPSFDAMDPDLMGNPKAEPPEDALFDQAVKIVTEAKTASTTFLQRKLKIGYARAASLIDELESKGIIGPAEGAKPRRVLNIEPLGMLDE